RERPEKSREGQRRPGKAREGQRRPGKAREGQGSPAQQWAPPRRVRPTTFAGAQRFFALLATQARLQARSRRLAVAAATSAPVHLARRSPAAVSVPRAGGGRSGSSATSSTLIA